MPWREAVEPVRMERVALVAPKESLRDVLAAVADAGVVEIDLVGLEDGTSGEAARRLQRLATEGVPPPRLSRHRPDLDELERRDRVDLLAGEAELEQYALTSVTRGSVAGLTGWAPAAELPAVGARISPFGGAAVPLPRPRGVDPPTLLRTEGRLHRSFAPLVNTYATAPYADVDPTILAGFAYVVMFGMMFADAGHGALLLVAGLLLRAGWPRRLAAKLRPVWLFIVGAGLSAMVFGALFGEFFGPTGVLPVVWLEPLEEPITLLFAAVGAGAVLLAGAYALGVINRFREGGWRYALVAPSGIAGIGLFMGLGLLALGSVTGSGLLVTSGVLVAVAGLVLVFLGLLATAGGGGAGIAQAAIELFDSVIRLGTNLISFARLAAFGLTHAALGLLVWSGTSALWQQGGPSIVAAVAVFLVGTAVAFTLEAIIAGVQALRLEYYELFSRVFSGEGRPFQPWHVPLDEKALDTSIPERAS